MNDPAIDRLARLFAGDHSRRRMLGLVAGGALSLVGLPLATAAKQDKDKNKDKDKGNGPGCRGEGHPCEGNQTCCEGLTCSASGPGAASRCTAGCAGDCPQSEPVVVVDADIDVEADCVFAGKSNTTTCTFTAAAGTGTVSSIALPASALCTEVVDGDYEDVDLGANVRPTGTATGLKSTKSEGGSAVVTLVLAGEVAVAATATYWCETDGAVLVPVTGPGLSCEAPMTPTADDVSDSTGAVVVVTYACDVADADADIDWFDTCTTQGEAMTFRLSRTEDGTPDAGETQPTDGDGRCSFRQLRPGTYQLESTDDAWCHAESDSVDDQGNVLVRAGKRATVWVFYCTAAS
jgi:hypothetical protein